LNPFLTVQNKESKGFDIAVIKEGQGWSPVVGQGEFENMPFSADAVALLFFSVEIKAVIPSFWFAKT
jgi:hypothetical protein